MRKSVEEKLQEVLDREDIRELRYRYCRAVDAQDFDAVEACFTSDVCVDYGVVGKFESRDALIRMMRGYAEANSIIGLHTALNPIVEFTSKQTATVHWVSQFSSYDPVKGASIKQSGTYVDQCVKTENGWKIESCTYNMLFHDMHSSGQGTPLF